MVSIQFTTMDLRKEILMKKIIVLTVACLMSVSLSACGSISDKVTQSVSTIEVGSAFDVQSAFACKDGISIELKHGETISTGQLGEVSATFVISNGKKQEEKDFSFAVVDTQAPEIIAADISIYRGTEFDPDKYVEVRDNSGEELTAIVESSNVDVSAEGIYAITYSATDSTGNASSKTVDVEVLSFETAEDVMDMIDQYLSQSGYTQFKYNKNDFDSVFVKGPKLDAVEIDSSRKVVMYPEIYIDEEIFESEYRVVGINFRFEFSDRTESMDERYSLYADKLSIESGDDKINIVFDGIPDIGEYERDEYLSAFNYTVEAKDFPTLEKILSTGEALLEVDTKDSSIDFSIPVFEQVDKPYSFEYILSSNDIEILQSTLEIAESFCDVLGIY